MKRILIIKSGLTETFQTKNSISPSIGDVLRTTFILHYYSDYSIDWVSKNKYGFLKQNEHISNIYDLSELEKIDTRDYEKVINLEKDADTLNLINGFENVLGFRSTDPYNQSFCLTQDEIKSIFSQKHHRNYFELLAKALGKEWNNENNIYPVATSEIKYDIGLNYKVGSTWPTKEMNLEKWEILAQQCAKSGYTYSFQEHFSDLKAYGQWINSCNIIVTQDSLGFHLANALGKKIICLVGPTRGADLHIFNRGHILDKNIVDCPLMPCYESKCQHSEFCMDAIDTLEIKDLIRELTNES